MSPAHTVKRMARNDDGRDFVIGDIHGAFDLVLAGMARVGFDPKKDRIFSVGDLVDRGPGSPRALRFLAQPYVHAVRGNHEQNFLDLYAQGEPDPEALEVIARRFGMDWWLDVDDSKRRQLLAAFAALPIVIEVPTSRGTVGIVHGDVPMGMDWASFLSAVERGNQAVLDVALSGRGRITEQRDDGVQGVGRVYVGHTPQWGGAMRYGNVYAIDTGAIFGQILDDHDGHLTVADLTFSTVALSMPRETVDAIDVILGGPEPQGMPFGNYAMST